MRGPAWALFLFFLSNLALAQNDVATQAPDYAYSREWQVLMHYRPTLFGGFKSEADGPQFFFSPDGRRDPLKEMLASVAAMSQEGLPSSPSHPQCAFPARYRYLKRVFNLTVKDVVCEDHKWWRENLPFTSVSVIFASYYANNPSSIFGHTFLRINSSEQKNISDYGVDFTAIADTDHGLEFAIRGLVGGYIGLFSLKPYYMKMNEYLEGENRDLWEYDLNLTPAQIATLLDHLWELQKNTYFDYYFLDENCSYQLLTLLEVANPDWELSREFVWKTIPIDSVKKIIETPGAVKGYSYRPAFKKTVEARYRALTQPERGELAALLERRRLPAEVTSPKVLDAAITKLRYQRFEFKRFTPSQTQLLNDTLLRRAQVGGKVDYPDVKESLPVESMRPDRSHDSEKYSIAYGNNTAIDRFTEITLKAAMNDLLDVDNGYPKHSMIDMAKLKLRYAEERRSFYLEELKYAEAISLFPISDEEFRWSWRAGGRSYRVYDLACDHCVSHQLKSGMGLAKNIASLDLTLYSLLLANVEVSRDFYRGYRLAPALNLGGVTTITERWKLSYDIELNHDLNRRDAYRDVRLYHQLGMSYNFRREQEWRLSALSASALKERRPTEELSLSYSFYY